MTYKYAVIKVDNDGKETIELYCYLKLAKAIYEIALEHSELYDQIYLTTYTKTRGVGQRVRSYVG